MSDKYTDLQLDQMLDQGLAFERELQAQRIWVTETLAVVRTFVEMEPPWDAFAEVARTGQPEPAARLGDYVLAREKALKALNHE